MNQAFCTIKPVNEQGVIKDYRISETNATFRKQTGLDDAEGNLISDLFPGIGEEWLKKFEYVLYSGKPCRFEGSVIYQTQKLWYDVSVFPDQEYSCLAVLFKNISARKKIQQYFRKRLEEKVKQRTAELEESRDFIKRITETSPDIFYIIDLDLTRLTFISESVSSYGYDAERIYSWGTNVFRELVHPDDLEERMKNIHQMASMKPGEVRESEFRIRDQSGKWHFIYNRNTVFKLRNDQPYEVLGIAQDITTRKLAEDAFALERNKNSELKRINEVMDTFVFAVAHDLKAPVSNLMTLTNIIEQTGDISLKLELQKKYRVIIDILNKTITGLLDVISVEKMKESGIKTLSLENIFAIVRSELKEKINEVRPLIKTDFSCCGQINYIEPYLISIFRNLITNALKYRHEARPLSIEISSARDGRYCLLTFRDNGIGIDLHAYGDDLFKPFKRLSRGSEGTGIGLHLIKNIVTRNNGKIEVRSVPGLGTAFLIYLNEYNL